MKDEDFLYGKPKEEIDEPLDDAVAVEDNLELHRLDT